MQPTQPSYQHAPPAPSGGGMSTVVIVIIVAVVGGIFVIGVLAALAIFGTSRYLANAKTAEAYNSVAVMNVDAQAAFEADQLGMGTATHGLCASASAPVPARLSDVAAKKYQSSAADWDTDAASNAGFSCLKFSMSSPQYFQYDYKRTGSGAKVGDGYVITARGDLDGDGTPSTFTMKGRITAADVLTSDPTITESNVGE